MRDVGGIDERHHSAASRDAELSALAQDWDTFHTTHQQQHDWYGPPDATKRRPLLDKPSEPHPILNMLMDEALTRIMLVSDGAVASLKIMIHKKGSRDAVEPHSDLATIVDNLDGLFLACRTHRQRLAVIKGAQEMSVRLRYSPKSDILVRGTRGFRLALAKDPRPQRVVAADYRVSSKTISAARKEFRDLLR